MTEGESQRKRKVKRKGTKRTRALRSVLFFMLPLTCVAVYLRVSYMVTDDWQSELLSFAVLPTLLLNMALVPAAMLVKGRSMNLILPLMALLVAQKPMNETFALNFRHESGTPDIRVMSFNVASFNPSRSATRQGDTLVASAIYGWLREIDAPDVLCIQEFYDSSRDDFDSAIDSIIEAGGYAYAYMNPHYVTEYGGVFGVATFLKKRPLRSGRILYDSGPVNKASYHDIEVNGSVVRIINAHLASMSIRWQTHERMTAWDSFKQNMQNMLPRLQEGHDRRMEELECILEYVDSSPYPVILCADLNALPYSESYQRIRRRMGNTFEAVGLGMGITYHHFPFFVRIDNLFYNKTLRPEYFITHKEFRASDHYPIEAGFSLVVE
jgi:endonuclease/exonuclease/phosphatase family metal-dependent hydrolase